LGRTDYGTPLDDWIALAGFEKAGWYEKENVDSHLAALAVQPTAEVQPTAIAKGSQSNGDGTQLLKVPNYFFPTTFSVHQTTGKDDVMAGFNKYTAEVDRAEEPEPATMVGFIISLCILGWKKFFKP
jgi:hypothetical protein